MIDSIHNFYNYIPKLTLVLLFIIIVALLFGIPIKLLWN